MQSPFDSPLSGFRSPFGGRRLGGALAAYAVTGFTPKLVFDFETETYATGGSVSTFDDSIDYEGNSNKVMTDSDRLPKWAPHNFVRDSEQFSSGQWFKGETTTTDNLIAAPNESMTADKIIESTSDTAHYVSNNQGLPPLFDYIGLVTIAVFAKKAERDHVTLYASGPGDRVCVSFDLINKNVRDTFSSGDFTNLSPTIEDYGNGWFLCKLKFYAGSPVSASVPQYQVDDGVTALSSNGCVYDGDGTSGIYFWGAHVYRSDLGGMVNNPDRGDSYVLTTDSPVYLPRRGHHVYDGSSYVNEGLLVELEARTNLDPNSDDLSAWTIIDTAIVKDETGADGVTASAHSIEATAANGTALEQITAASADHVWSCLMKRVTGTGTIETTVDGGTTWVDVTSDINSDEFIQVGTGPGITVTDPEFGVRIGTSGDKVAVQVSQLEQTSGQFSSPIPTSGATVTRAAEDKDSDKLTYDSAAMWFTLDGAETYADEGTAGQVTLFDWRADANNRITVSLDTDGAETGEITLTMVSGGTSWTVAADYLSPGILQSFSIAWRVTSSEINLAVGGTAATAVSVTSIPDLSTATASFAGNGTRELFRHGHGDIGDAGLEEASS